MYYQIFYTQTTQEKPGYIREDPKSFPSITRAINHGENNLGNEKAFFIIERFRKHSIKTTILFCEKGLCYRSISLIDQRKGYEGDIESTINTVFNNSLTDDPLMGETA